MFKIPAAVYSIEGLIVLGSAMGVLFPTLASALYPLLPTTLASMFFISVLSVKTSKNKQLFSKKSITKLLTMSIVKLIAIPMCLFYAIVAGLSTFGIKSFTLAFGIVLRFFAAPTFGTPSYVRSYHGNHNRSFFLTLVSNLISIISIPVLVCFLSDKSLSLSYFFIMMIDVFIIIVPPLILGYICKRNLPRFVKKINNSESLIIKILLVIATVGSVAGVREKMVENPMLITLISVIACIVYTILTLFGWIIEKGQTKDKICSSMFYSICSATPIVFAHIFFKDNSTITMSVVIVNLFQFVPFKLLSIFNTQKKSQIV